MVNLPKKKPIKKKIIRRPKAGQPSKKELINLQFIEALYSFNVIDEQICQLLGITRQTLDNWKKDEKFFAAIRRGKKISNERVEKTLFERATGYTHPEEDIRVVRGEIKRTPILRHYPPETAAMTFWLKNRDKEKWRDKQDIDIGLSEETLNTVLSLLPPDYAEAVKTALIKGK